MHLFTEIEIKEPSVSTILMNFENKFDPYGAMSTPLYQTATFKQVLLKGKQLYLLCVTDDEGGEKCMCNVGEVLMYFSCHAHNEIGARK